MNSARGQTRHLATADPRRNAMLAALPAASYAALLPHLRVKALPAAISLWDHGEMPKRVCFPLSGVIAVTLAVHGDGLVEVAKIGRESAAGGIGGAAAAATSGTTLTESVIASIPARKFREIANWDRPTGEAVETACAWIAQQAQQLCACSACHKVGERLSRWLLHVGDQVTGDRFDITQNAIAVALGTRRTTVTIHAQGLMAEGLITYRRGKLRIVNRPALTACACECYAALAPARWPFTRSRSPLAPERLPATEIEIEEEVA